MTKPRIGRAVTVWASAALASLCGARALPEYRVVLDGLGFLLAGPLMSYLVATLPRGAIAAANRDRPPFRRIPPPGKLAGKLLFILGVCMGLSGLVTVIRAV